MWACIRYFRNRVCILNRTMGLYTAFLWGSLCFCPLYLLIVRQFSVYREMHCSHRKRKKWRQSLLSFLFITGCTEEECKCAQIRDLQQDPMWEGFRPKIFCLCPHTQTVQILHACQTRVCVPHLTLLQNFPVMNMMFLLVLLYKHLKLSSWEAAL